MSQERLFDGKADRVWASRMANGMTEAAREAWSNKVETAATVGSGLAIGAAIQAGLNNAELMGGKIGVVAKVGKVAMIGVPLALSAARILTAEDSARETGKMVFETGLFLGAGKIGTMADRVPGAGKLFGPRVTSELPYKLDFQVRGNNVRINHIGSDAQTPFQVRLANGNGFTVRSRGDAALTPMPAEVPGVGRLAYGAHRTELTTRSGTYVRPTGHTVDTFTTHNGVTIGTSDGRRFDVFRSGGPLGSERITFTPNNPTTVLQGNYRSGRLWSFHDDGSIAMRSTPASKFRMHLDPDGDGLLSVAHGTTRGIMGMAGPISNRSPLVRNETRVSINPPADGSRSSIPFAIPDVTPPPKDVIRNLRQAHIVLETVANPNR